MIRRAHRFTHRRYLLSTCARLVLTLALLGSFSLVAWAQAAAARPNRGIVATDSYAVSDIERVNLTNGNLNLSIPLASLPPIAGGKLGLTLSANYNSKMWDVVRSEVQPDPSNINSKYPINQLQLGSGGWNVDARYSISFEDADWDYAWLPPAHTDPEYNLLTLNRWTKVVLYTPDGAAHELRPKDHTPYSDPFLNHPYLRGYYKDNPNTANTSLRYYSFDGSYLWAKIDPAPFLFAGPAPSWTLYLPDGTKVEQSGGIQRITDTNGNKIKIFTTVDSAGRSTSHYQDELTGREILMGYNPATNTSGVHYQTVGGAWMTIIVNYGATRVFGKTYLINDALCFSAANYVDETIMVIRSIIFPQTEPGLPGKQFTFNYNSDTVVSQNQQWDPDCDLADNSVTFTIASQGWGSLSRIGMPSGASVDYTYEWDGEHALWDANDAAREILETKIITHDGASDIWTYATSPVGGGVSNPDGSSIAETMYPHDLAFAHSNAGFGGKEGLVYRIDNSGKTRVERHWTLLNFGGSNIAPGAGGIATFNPVVDAEYISLMEGGQPVKMSAKTFQYDFNGNLLQETHYDWFDPALVSRDAQGVPTGVPSGAVALRVVNHSYYNQATAANSPNVYARRDLATATPRILNAPQQSIIGPSQTQFSYDNQGYGAAPTIGNLTRVSNWDDQAGVWRNTNYGYDSFGNRISITDPKNNVTNIAFDPATHAQPTQVTVDPLNGTGAQTITTVYDYWTGLVTSVTNSNNQTTTTSYINQLLGAVDPFGRPGVVTGPLVNSVVDGVTYTNQQRKVKTTYFDDARQVVVESDLNQTGDYKLKSRASHDQLGRVIKTESNEDGVANYSISTENIYVQMGLITLISNPKRSTAATTDGWTRTTRDTLGRVIEVATFSGAPQPPNAGTNSSWTGSVTTSYNANQVTVTDQAGKKRSSKSNSLSQFEQVIEDPDGVAYQTNYSYDTLGNLSVVNQGGQQYRYFFYDSLGRLTRAKNSEESTNSLLNLANPPAYNNNWSTAYSYDANGNIVSKTDARNITTTYGYDGLNRNTTVSYSDSTPGISRTYDTATLGKGRLQKTETAGSMGSRVTINAYDAVGRPLSQSQQFFHLGSWGTSYTKQQTYDLAGAVTTLTYPSGHTVNYSHDQVGRLSSFSGNLGGLQRTYADMISYNSAGQMIKERFRTNTSLYRNSHYNNRQQLVAIRVGDSATDAWNRSRGAFDFLYGTTAVASGNVFANDTDNNGNLRRQINYVPLAGGGEVIPQRHDYAYDWGNRLISFTEAQRDSSGQWTPNVAWQNMSYDRYGNRKITSASGSGVSNYNPSYDLATNRINGLGYDAAGNIISDPLTGGTMSYNAENRLLSATSGGGGNYVYDADGKRVRRITTEGEIWQVYGCGGELLAEYAANVQPTVPQKEYGYRGGQLLIIAKSGSGGGVSFVKPALKSSTDLIGKASPGVDGEADGLFEVDEAVADLEFDEDFGLTTADVSSDNNTGTHIDEVTGTTAEGYGNALLFNGIGAALLVEHPAGAAPPPPTTYSIWPLSTIPTIGMEDPGSAIEVGLKFRSDVNGYITGVKFYKGGPAAGSAHIGNLWTSSGTLLGSVTFANQTASGWQQASFSTPIPITANTTYVVSYFAPQGNYLGEDDFFATSGVDNGPLHALRDGFDGANGLYRYTPTSGFPTDTYRSENYWVDVLFTNEVPGSDTTPPTVASVSPAAGASNINANANVIATFSEAMNAATVNAATVELRDPLNALVSATVSYNAASLTATLDPTAPLAAGITYTARVRGGSTDPRVKDVAGNSLAADVTWTFTTTPPPDTTPPTVTSFSPAAGATNVNADANVTVTFSEAMNAATVNGATVELRDPSNALVSATVSYDPASFTATLNPTAALAAGATYTARVRGGGTDPRVKDAAGNALATDKTWTFTTAQSGSGGIKWLVTDHLGSTRMVISETGNLGDVTRHDFAPFGEELLAGAEIRSAGNGYGGDWVRQKFGSKERDIETGLNFFGARYLSSVQGRFTSADPIFFQKEMPADPQRFNLYSYVRNNPLKYVDPKGERIELLGDPTQRAAILGALKKALHDPGGYISEKSEVGKDGKTRYFVEIQDGKDAEFRRANAVSQVVHDIIKSSSVVGVQLWANGATVATSQGVSRKLSNIERPGFTDPRAPGGPKIHIIDPASLPSNYKGIALYPAAIMWPRNVINAELADVLIHELGHAYTSIINVVGSDRGGASTLSGDFAVQLENTSRRLRDPNAPLRVKHNVDPFEPEMIAEQAVLKWKP